MLKFLDNFLRTKTSKLPANYVIIDIEVTNTDAHKKGSEILEIAAIRFFNHVPEDKYETILNPRVPLPKNPLRNPPITTKDILGKPTINEALPILLKFIGELPILGYNIKHDISFIYRDIKRLGLERPYNEVIDVYHPLSTMLRDKHGNQLLNYHLETVLNLSLAKPIKMHHALGDCRACFYVYYYALWYKYSSPFIKPIRWEHIAGAGADEYLSKINEYDNPYNIWNQRSLALYHQFGNRLLNKTSNECKIIINSFYIIPGFVQCPSPKCGIITPIIIFGVTNMQHIFRGQKSIHSHSQLCLYSSIPSLSLKTLTYLADTYNYSKTVNHCCKCNCIYSKSNLNYKTILHQASINKSRCIEMYLHEDIIIMESQYNYLREIGRIEINEAASLLNNAVIRYECTNINDNKKKKHRYIVKKHEVKRIPKKATPQPPQTTPQPPFQTQ